MPAVALTIAGSDPSGGAGIQADLKTFHQFGVYGQAVITLITVQNTTSVSRVEVLSRDLVRQQIEAIIADIPPAAAKTGALGSAENIEAVAELAKGFSFPLIVDPVMISKHGKPLLAPNAVDGLRRRLLPLSSLVMPNIPEAEALTGISINSKDDMLKAAQKLLEYGPKTVLVKGGHLAGEPVDLLFDGGARYFESPRIETRHTHGTGCAYSAAITAALALGMPLGDAVTRAHDFVRTAIHSAPGLGSGFGPLNFHAPAGCC